MEVKLTGELSIPAGWTMAIVLFREPRHREILIEAINLQTIIAGIVVPLGPYRAQIPYDLVKSDDSWHLELYIFDPFRSSIDEALKPSEAIFRSEPVDFIELREKAKSEASEEKIRVVPTSQRVKADWCQLFWRTSEGTKRFRIYAKKVIKFGKEENANDLVLQLFPRNEKNDRGTNFISRRHGNFEYRDGNWQLKDFSTNGIMIDGRPLVREKEHLLRDGEMVSIARVLDLKFRCDGSHGRLIRLNNLAGEETYIFMNGMSITLGNGGGNAIDLETKMLPDRYGEILYEDNEFWLKDLQNNEICPMADGLEFSIGNGKLCPSY